MEGRTAVAGVRVKRVSNDDANARSVRRVRHAIQRGKREGGERRRRSSIDFKRRHPSPLRSFLSSHLFLSRARSGRYGTGCTSLGQKEPFQFTPRRTVYPSVPPVSTRCRRGYPLRCCPPILHSSWQIISRSKRDAANGERTENPFCIASRRRRRIQCTAFSSPSSQRPTDGRRGRKGTEFGLLIETLSLAVAAMPQVGIHVHPRL